MGLKLFGREIIFEEFQVPTYVIMIPKRHKQTDDLLSHHRALR